MNELPTDCLYKTDTKIVLVSIGKSTYYCQVLLAHFGLMVCCNSVLEQLCDILSIENQ
jgi:hypothetical protein